MDDKVSVQKSQPYYDADERDRIRRTLIQYMKVNRIGVPTLQRVIAEANGIVIDRVPLKTLQRFLADTHRSNDMIIRFYRVFLDTLPDEPLDRFGEELAAFHAGAEPRDMSSERPALMDCTGLYEGMGFIRPQQGPMIADQHSTTKLSDLTLTQRAASRYLRAAERVSNWRAERETTGSARRAYEGVAVQTAGGILVALRSSLTGSPRTYWLTGHPAGLAGNMAEPFTPLDREPVGTFDRMHFSLLVFHRTTEPGA